MLGCLCHAGNSDRCRHPPRQLSRIFSSKNISKFINDFLISFFSASYRLVSSPVQTFHAWLSLACRQSRSLPSPTTSALPYKLVSSPVQTFYAWLAMPFRRSRSLPAPTTSALPYIFITIFSNFINIFHSIFSSSSKLVSSPVKNIMLGCSCHAGNPDLCRHPPRQLSRTKWESPSIQITRTGVPRS